MWKGQEYTVVWDDEINNVKGGAPEVNAAEWIFTKVPDE